MVFNKTLHSLLHSFHVLSEQLRPVSLVIHKQFSVLPSVVIHKSCDARRIYVLRRS